MSRNDAWIMAILAFATVLVRWPIRSRFLWAWDSNLYAFGVENYDIAAAAPHPPGYPVYIVLGRLFHLFIADVNAALIGLSMTASAAAVALLFGLLREVANRRAALTGAVLFAFSPVFFLNGTVALSYALEAPLSIGAAWAAWRLYEAPSVLRSIAFGILGGLAIGVRQALLFTLTPLLVLGALWPFDGVRNVTRRGGLAAGAAVVAGLSWFLPMLFDTGPERWFHLVRRQSRLVFGHSVFEAGATASQGHVANVAMYLAGERWLLPTFIILLAIAGWNLLARDGAGRRRLSSRSGGLILLLSTWILPGLLFTMFVHTEPYVQNSGYVLAFLPGLYAVYAIVGEAGASATATMAGTLKRPTVGSIVSALLLMIPVVALAPEAIEHATSSTEALQENLTTWSALSTSFAPNETGFLTAWGWPWDIWYFPENHVWHYWPGTTPAGAPAFGVRAAYRHHVDPPFYDADEAWPDLGTHPIPSKVRQVVLGYSFPPEALRPDVVVQTRTLPNGLTVSFIEVTPELPTIEAYLRPL